MSTSSHFGRKGAVWATVLLTIVVLGGLQLGFQSSAPTLKLPVGEWAGEGRYVYETWATDSSSPDAPKAISTSDRYPTRLTIRAEKLAGHDVLVFDILSRHKDVGILEDDVHAVLAFEEGKRLSDDAVLYRLVVNDMNPSEGKALHYEESAPRASASVLREADDLVFTVQYGENYNETYRFRGGAKGATTEVLKTGLATPGEDDNEAGFIHWAETLKKK